MVNRSNDGLLSVDPERANATSFARLDAADPWVVDVRPAIDALPGMRRDLVLTSGAPMPWTSYEGGQREALIGGALYEGLANSREETIEGYGSGDIAIGSCHAHGAVGSLAGIYTASMPVFMVENRTDGTKGYCNFYEGENPRRLNYGCYDEGVRERLLHVDQVVAPAVGEAIRRANGIALKPMIARALRMGDEVHSRNTAASILFLREMTSAFADLLVEDHPGMREAMEYLVDNDYSFLRLSMAAAKSSADAMEEIGSTLVSAMAFSCRGFSIRVAGLGQEWFNGPPPIPDGKLFDGHTTDEIAWMGGESTITETVGLGGFAQACALSLQAYQGGSAQSMIRRNEEMYRITYGENTTFRIPLFDFRGTPTGIDIRKVLETGVLPVMDVGLAGRNGGQIGAGIIRAPIECFERAHDAYMSRYAV